MGRTPALWRARCVLSAPRRSGSSEAIAPSRLKRGGFAADRIRVRFSSLQECVDYWHEVLHESIRDLTQRLSNPARAVCSQEEVGAVTDWRGTVELSGLGQHYELAFMRPRRRPIRLVLAPDTELSLSSSAPTEILVHERARLTAEVGFLRAHAHDGRIEVEPLPGADADIFLHAVGRRARVQAAGADVFLSHQSLGRVSLESRVKVFGSAQVTIDDWSRADVYGRGRVTLGTTDEAERVIGRIVGRSATAIFYGPGRLTINEDSAPSAIVLHVDNVRVDGPEMTHEWWEESSQRTELYLAENPPPFPDDQMMERLARLRDRHDPLHRQMAAAASLKPLQMRRRRPSPLTHPRDT